jgi:protein-S-isoprenylcysteine O-methyltransferase Ste14
MYLAVLVILDGWSVWFQSLALVTYAAVVGTLFHLRVVLYEEPRLGAGFGAQWLSYRDRVRRWL